jgi:23S rRNA pseudouridine1911/1915/1917 synthase
MSVTTHTPRSALTHWRIRELFTGACLLDLDIRTGRTHQIRVHCLTMGHPVIGDPVYGRRGEKKQLAAASVEMSRAVQRLNRQMLHAWRLSFVHPTTGKRMMLEAPMPEDMVQIIHRFRAMSASRQDSGQPSSTDK